MSNIEWTDETWNPVIGCAKVADGCKHCYAEKMSKRLAAMEKPETALYSSVVTETGQFNGRVLTRPEVLDKPLRWRKPRTVFVNSMSDLFHKDVPFEFIAAVYGVMAACPQHTFQVLTKRPERMLEFFEWVQRNADHNQCSTGLVFGKCLRRALPDAKLPSPDTEIPNVPLPNVWHGTSIANQKDADRNIPILLQVPSAVRFISAEPLLGDVWLQKNWIDALVCQAFGTNALDWVIVGCESGPSARGYAEYEARARSIVHQCAAAGVKCFHKQMPVGGHKSADPAEWPEDLRVREFPADN